MPRTKKPFKLEDYLDDEQKAQWKAYEQFIVVSKGKVYLLGNGQQIYLLRDGRTANVRNIWATDELTGGFASVEVSLLTQLLWLQTNPDEFLDRGCSDNYYPLGEIEFAPEMVGWYTKEHYEARQEAKAAKARLASEARRALEDCA